GLIADWLVQEDLAAGRLVDLFPSLDATATDFETAAWILYPSRTYLPQKVRVMIDFLKDRLGENFQPA
ncbi:MAG: LysR family transcriptional regulator, partial [Pseudomonadota bacterium]